MTKVHVVSEVLIGLKADVLRRLVVIVWTTTGAEQRSSQKSNVLQKQRCVCMCRMITSAMKIILLPPRVLSQWDISPGFVVEGTVEAPLAAKCWLGDCVESSKWQFRLTVADGTPKLQSDRPQQHMLLPSTMPLL